MEVDESAHWYRQIFQAQAQLIHFISASHVTKTRHAHQVTAASIHILLHRAYESEEMSVLPLEE